MENFFARRVGRVWRLRVWGKYPPEEAFEIQQRILAVNCEVSGGGPHPVGIVIGTSIQVEQMPSGEGGSRAVRKIGLGCQEQWKRNCKFLSTWS